MFISKRLLPTKSLTLIVFLACLSCKSSGPKESPSAMKSTADLDLCVALRGNGDFITTHFGALARIVEHYGLIDGLAGGSSSTVTMFLYESILKNPTITSLDGEKKKFAVALLLKSLLGYLESMAERPDALAITLFQDLQKELNSSNLFTNPDQPWTESKRTLYKILSKQRYLSLVNPEVIDALSGQSLLGFKNEIVMIRELREAAKSLGGFTATDDRIFFRPNLVSFKAFANIIGLIGDFYAGYSESANPYLDTFIRACATNEIQPSKSWAEVSNSQTNNLKCGEAFESALNAYQKDLGSFTELVSKRSNEVLGGSTPSIVMTGLIKGSVGIKQYNEAMKRYLNGETPKLSLDFERDIRFGHWLSPDLKGPVTQGISTRRDAKAQLFESISSSSTWADALAVSPAEPSLSPAIKLSDDVISVGGWADLHPVQILYSAGCKKVIYVTRRGQESKFVVSPEPVGNRPALGVAELLGATEKVRQDLYTLSNSMSSYSDAIRKSSAVWCSDWTNIKSGQFKEMMNEAYHAAMLSSDSWILEHPSGYSNIASSHIEGCSM
jgi:hypothetical protein